MMYTIGNQETGQVTFMDWTTEPPKEAGWYWVRWTARTREPIIVQVLPDEADGHLMAWAPGFAQPFNLHYFHPWLGPLPEPEPPK